MLLNIITLLVAAPITVYAQCSKSTATSCSTVMATVPAWWPVLTLSSTTTLKTITLTGSTTVYTTTTVAAKPVTSTSTSMTTVGVTTTATPGTNTAYYTQTATVTTTGTTTTVLTSTATSTIVSTSTTWSTSIVAAASGFIPAYDSSGDTNQASSKRAMARRGLLKDLSSLLQPAVKAAASSSLITLPKFNPVNWIHPVAVNCAATVAPTCRVGATVTSTLTSTAVPSTVISTTRATATTTNVIIPGNVTSTITIATSTVTSSTSVLVTSTALTTLTTTLTSVVTSVTSTYAACATSNILGSFIAPGNAISAVYFADSSATVATSQQTSPYDCCVACQNGNECQFFQYTGSNGQCYVVGNDADWCPNNDQEYNSATYFTWDSPSNVKEANYVGNGVCGVVMDAGSAS